MKFILASSNKHKVEEFNDFFKASKLEVISPSEKIEVVEDGNSFNENALKKASAYFEKYNSPVLADDSGLVVEAMPGELGVYSARFGGEGLTDKDRALLLLEKMKDEKNRKAYFNCTLCFYISPEEVYFFEGRFKGEIIDEYIGDHGFGYDPVFKGESQEQGQSVAMDPEYKSQNSHRSIAVKQALKFFS